MLWPARPKDKVVRSQADFHQYLAASHLAEQAESIAFIHDTRAVSDTFGVSLLDGLAYVEGQSFGRNQAHGQLAGVQADVDFGIDAMQGVEHLHVQVKVNISLHAGELAMGLVPPEG